MSTLSSTSTIDQIKNSYLDNASFEEDADAAKAKAFITACRMLLLKLPDAANHAGESFQFGKEHIREEMNRARTWLATNPDATSSAGGGVRHVDFADFR